MVRSERGSCLIDGCESNVLKKGWCSTHYWRWFRTGDPTLLKKRKARSFYDDVVLAYDGDDCLYWPYAKDKAGYGQMGVNGSKRSVHRLVCIEEYGAPPSEMHQAAHSCGKGHLGCCNRRHVSWKTPLENTADQLIHGTRIRGERQGMSKLTENDVRTILKFKGKVSQKELASRYGVSPPAIQKIMAGIRWRHVSL